METGDDNCGRLLIVCSLFVNKRKIYRMLCVVKKALKTDMTACQFSSNIYILCLLRVDLVLYIQCNSSTPIFASAVQQHNRTEISCTTINSRCLTDTMP